jgi:membrane protein DedA with SNARE-associated domain
MPWQRFTAFNAIGAAIWVGFWTTLAYLLGTHITAVGEAIHRYQWPAIALIAVAVTGYVMLHLRRRKRRRATEQQEQAALTASEAR